MQFSNTMRNMNFLLFCGVLAFLSGPALATLTPSEAFTTHADLKANEDYRVYWKWDTTTITFEVHVRTLGWVGLGFSSNGGMTNADVVIAWVENGAGTIQDRYATTTALPALDASQDYTLISASETSSHTVVKFSRPLTNCDSNDRDITEDTVRMIWSYGSADPVSGTPSYHGTTNRGSKSIQLLTAQPTPPTMPADAWTIDFLMENFTIPTYHTRYQCKMFTLPTFGSKVHTIKVEPLVQPGNENYVHHALIYACSNPQALGQYLNGDFECYATSSQTAAGLCTEVAFSWAIGGGIFYFPTHVGYPLGAADSPTLLRMEVHYDNPGYISNVVDSSGLRITITNTTRQYDAGILEVGSSVTDQQIIPYGQTRFISRGACMSGCLAQAVNTTGIKAFAYLLHAHLLGAQIRLRHFRNNTELTPLAKDDSYDFNFQEFRHLKSEVQVYKTDDLIVDCVYNSAARTNTTTGGLASAEEMCLVYLYIYPKVALSHCQSKPTKNNLATFLTNINFDSNGLATTAPYINQSVTTILKSYTWDNSSVNSFQSTITSGNFTYDCKIDYARVTAINDQEFSIPSMLLEPTTGLSACLSQNSQNGTQNSATKMALTSLCLLLAPLVLAGSV